MKFPISLVVLVSLMMAASSANAQFVVAHRGASFEAPENTLASFKLAWERGADAIEGDFYVTKDNKIVCIHDKNTKRTSPGTPVLSVAGSTLAELQQVDVGAWKDAKYAGERMPTLDQVLETVPDGKQIFVEVKCGTEILPLLKPALENSSLKDEQIAIICFDKDVVRQARKLMPQYRVNWLTSYKDGKPTVESIIKTLQQTGATGVGSKGDLSIIDQAFVDTIREAGFEFHVWTVNEVSDAKAFASFGAASITTDKPDVIGEALSQ